MLNFRIQDPAKPEERKKILSRASTFITLYSQLTVNTCVLENFSLAGILYILIWTLKLSIRVAENIFLEKKPDYNRYLDSKHHSLITVYNSSLFALHVNEHTPVVFFFSDCVLHQSITHLH